MAWLSEAFRGEAFSLQLQLQLQLLRAAFHEVSRAVNEFDKAR
ncbi:hypothetical protein NXY55_04670 [Aeromonas veronii]|nr:hypothetical protein [Aeromonas veronii]